MEELLRDADAGLDLALRWLTALAVAHCRPRPPAPPSSSAAGAAGAEPSGDTDMADAFDASGTGAADGSADRPNGVQGHSVAAATADGAAIAAAATPSDPRAAPSAQSKPSEAASEAGVTEAASKAAGAQPWGGLAGSPYEAALLALVKACRWQEENVSTGQSGRSCRGFHCCQGQKTMLTWPHTKHSDRNKQQVTLNTQRNCRHNVQPVPPCRPPTLAHKVITSGTSGVLLFAGSGCQQGTSACSGCCWRRRRCRSPRPRPCSGISFAPARRGSTPLCPPSSPASP